MLNKTINIVFSWKKLSFWFEFLTYMEIMV